jgi:hypothetical protein
MADDTALQLSRWIKKAEKLVEKNLVSTEMLVSIGNQVADRIRKRTQLGYGVAANGATRQRLKEMKPHSERYTAWRKENADRLSGNTAPTKQNLTLTGEMLANLAVQDVVQGERRVLVGFDDEFSQLKADKNTRAGRRFLFLSDIEIKAVNNFYRREVQKLVKSFNNS